MLDLGQGVSSTTTAISLLGLQAILQSVLAKIALSIRSHNCTTSVQVHSDLCVVHDRILQK